MAEPQITEIASYFAQNIPTEGVAEAESREAWRTTLRYARRTGAIKPLTELISRADPQNATLLAHCDALKG